MQRGHQSPFALGIVLEGAPPHTPTPPPAVDPPAWHRTLEEIGHIGPERFGATHFGFHSDVEGCRRELRTRLDKLEARVRAGLEADDDSDAEQFDREVRDELTPFVGEEQANRFFGMFPASTDWAGMAFYLERNT